MTFFENKTDAPYRPFYWKNFFFSFCGNINFRFETYAVKKDFRLSDPERKKQQLELSQANKNALKCVELMMKETEDPQSN